MRSGSVSNRISQFNRVTSPAALFLPSSENGDDTKSENKNNEDEAAKITSEDVGRIFDYYDKNLDGTISVKELIEVFKQLGVDTKDDKKLNSIISSLDVDNDGIVTRNNFKDWWFSSANLIEFDSAVRSLLFLYGMNFVGQKSDELHAFATYINRIFGEEEQQNNINNIHNMNVSEY